MNPRPRPRTHAHTRAPNHKRAHTHAAPNHKLPAGRRHLGWWIGGVLRERHPGMDQSRKSQFHALNNLFAERKQKVYNL